MQQNAFTLVMGLPHNTKIANTLSIFVTKTLTLALRQNGILLPPVMAKAHVIAKGVLSRGLLLMQVYRWLLVKRFPFPTKSFNGAKITFLALTSFVSSEDIDNHVNQFQLDQGYELTKTVPRTRSYHSFIPDYPNWYRKEYPKTQFQQLFNLTEPLQKFWLMTLKLEIITHVYTTMNGTFV